ncbi:carbon-phosphorus lyase complex subunit PhnI [Streptomyces carpinensis]|uniref:Carbon-phosphorus lyase complex subunit PhnI n=1 Tax=Streptomyces carpinensis TaxID=66369 RepID=A0ABV1W7H9_9ACTN|nr:carbon-phosphorus lyase complex subunit PhnI [Streptomyces carpinensis]
MGYSNAKGGEEAILAAEQLVRRGREAGSSPRLTLDQVTERLRLAVDRVMGEASLWSPGLASRAVRQAEGDQFEAMQLLRAHRSTLPRLAYSEPVEVAELRVLRRVSSAFRNPPGSQILGRTLDYVGRLLDLMPEQDHERYVAELEASVGHSHGHGHGHSHDGHTHGDHEHEHRVPENSATRDLVGELQAVAAESDDDRNPPRVMDLMRAMDLLVERRTGEDPEPYDVTRQPARPGAPRSAVLSMLARAETGALVHFWYKLRFDPRSAGHEIPGEVRHGWLPLRVNHPLTGNPVQVAEVRVTDVETYDDLDRPDEDRSRIDVGYGLCFGHNERKAIAMAGLDLAVHRDGNSSEVAQQVLITLDGVEANGFLEHLKLPHHVDFRSVIDRKQAIRALQTGTKPVAATDATPTPGNETQQIGALV